MGSRSWCRQSHCTYIVHISYRKIVGVYDSLQRVLYLKFYFSHSIVPNWSKNTLQIYRLVSTVKLCIFVFSLTIRLENKRFSNVKIELQFRVISPTIYLHTYVDTIYFIKWRASISQGRLKVKWSCVEVDKVGTICLLYIALCSLSRSNFPFLPLFKEACILRKTCLFHNS